MIRLDPKHRLTPDQLIAHPFITKIREINERFVARTTKASSSAPLLASSSQVTQPSATDSKVPLTHPEAHQAASQTSECQDDKKALVD